MESKIFEPLVHIIVDENLADSINPPKIWIPLEFALMLRKDDVLFFPEEGEKIPEWVSKWENPDELYDNAITITQRNIDINYDSNKLWFWAKIG